MMEESLKSKTKKGLYWKFSEQAATYSMQFAVSIVMARLLSPEDFGIAALPSIFISIAQVFIDGSFGLALIRKPNLTEADLSTSFYYSIGVGIVCYLVMFFTAPLFADFYHQPILISLVRVSSLTFLWGPLVTPQSVILNRRLDFKTPARISIVNKLVSASVGIVVAYFGYGLWALIVSSLVSSFLGLIQTWLAVRWIPRERFTKRSFQYLWNFGNKMMCVKLLQTFYANISSILLGKIGSMDDIGLLNRASGFASLPAANIGGVLSSVTFPVLSKIQNEDENIAVQYRRIIKVSSFVMIPIMLLLCALAHPTVIVLVTDKWEPCVPLLQILCFSYMLQPVQGLNLNLLQIKGRTDLSLRIEIVKKVVSFIAIVIAVNYGLIVLCIVDFLMTMFALLLNTYYTGKLINVGYIRQMRDVMPSFLIGVIMLAVVFFVTGFLTNPWLQIIAGGSVGIIVYLLLAFSFHFKEMDDIKYLLCLRRK